MKNYKFTRFGPSLILIILNISYKSIEKKSMFRPLIGIRTKIHRRR